MYHPPDLHFMTLGRLVNPDIATVLDLGASTRLEPDCRCNIGVQMVCMPLRSTSAGSYTAPEKVKRHPARGPHTTYPDVELQHLRQGSNALLHGIELGRNTAPTDYLSGPPLPLPCDLLTAPSYQVSVPLVSGTFLCLAALCCLCYSFFTTLVDGCNC